MAMKESHTAIIEMASAADYLLEKDPMNATTYGVGEMIKDAIQRGCRNFIIGIGERYKRWWNRYASSSVLSSLQKTIAPWDKVAKL